MIGQSFGRWTVVRKAEARDKSGPGAFVVGIAVFKNGAPYQLPVRLRYRLKNNELFWFFELYRHDAVFDHAFKESCAKAQDGTGLPLFFGTPEA